VRSERNFRTPPAPIRDLAGWSGSGSGCSALRCAALVRALAVVRSVGGAILGLSKRAALTTALSRPLRRQGTERGSRGAASRRARESKRDRCESSVLSSAYLRRTTATATAAGVGRGLLLSRLSEPEARPVLQEARGDGGCIDSRPYLIRDGAHGPAKLRTRKYIL
jgi:hypothetical protein